MDQTKIGLLIRSLRRERGLTQLELAQRLGVTDRAVSKWERCQGCPDVSLLPGLAGRWASRWTACWPGTWMSRTATEEA